MSNFKIVFVKYPFDEDFDQYNNIKDDADVRQKHPVIIIETAEISTTLKNGANLTFYASVIVPGTSSRLNLTHCTNYLEVIADFKTNKLNKTTFFKFDANFVMILPRTEVYFDYKDLIENKNKTTITPTLSKNDSSKVRKIIKEPEFQLLIDDLFQKTSGRVDNPFDPKYIIGKIDLFK
jgi:hypothetical protein